MPKLHYTRFPVTSLYTGKLPTCCGLVSTSRFNGIWETIRHNRYNGPFTHAYLLQTCCGLATGKSLTCCGLATGRLVWWILAFRELLWPCISQLRIHDWEWAEPDKRWSSAWAYGRARERSPIGDSGAEPLLGVGGKVAKAAENLKDFCPSS